MNVSKCFDCGKHQNDMSDEEIGYFQLNGGGKWHITCRSEGKNNFVIGWVD